MTIQAWTLSSWSASPHLLPPMIVWWLFIIGEWVLVVKYLALTYVPQLEVSQAGKLTRRIIFEHRHRDRQRLICSHTCWWLLMICTMSTQWRISCIWLSALIPGCELINHCRMISSCLREMITACFQHLAGHLTGRSFYWMIVLSNNYLVFFDQVIILHICRGRRGHCPWKICCIMWRNFRCGDILDVEIS